MVTKKFIMTDHPKSSKRIFGSPCTVAPKSCMLSTAVMKSQRRNIIRMGHTRFIDSAMMVRTSRTERNLRARRPTRSTRNSRTMRTIRRTLSEPRWLRPSSTRAPATMPKSNTLKGFDK